MSELDTLLSDDNAVKHCCGQRGTGIEESKALIKDLFLELIGEYEKELVLSELLPGQPYIVKHEANQLRRELRKKVEEL